MWYLYGKHHRIGGPAVVCINGDQYWYQYGKIHRIDGPAIILANGKLEWWINGVKQNAPLPSATNHRLMKGGY